VYHIIINLSLISRMLNTRVSIGFKVVRDSEVAEDVPNVTVVSLQKLSA
jgi:hypothetical protein